MWPNLMLTGASLWPELNGAKCGGKEELMFFEGYGERIWWLSLGV